MEFPAPTFYKPRSSFQGSCRMFGDRDAKETSVDVKRVLYSWIRAKLLSTRQSQETIYMKPVSNSHIETLTF